MDHNLPKKRKEPGLRVLPEDDHVRLEPETKPAAKGPGKSAPSAAPVGVGRPGTGHNQAPAGTISENEERWGGGARRRSSTGWLVLAGVLFGGVAVWVVSTMFRAHTGKEETEARQTELARDLKKEEESVIAIQRGIERVAASYLGARTVEEKLVFCRQPERIKPLMEKYYGKHELVPLKFAGFTNLLSIALESRPFVLASSNTDDGVKVLAMEQVGDGRFLVDWEADVGYQVMEWETFLRKKPTEAVAMRVWVSRDDFYAYEFSDEEKYQCYRLTDSERRRHVFAYVVRGSRQMHDIESSASGSLSRADPSGMILSIRYPGNSDSKKCVVIDEVITHGWIYVTPPAGKEQGKE